MTKLDTKQIAWIFSAAGEHFASEVARLENELVRHNAMIELSGGKDDVFISASPVQKTRQGRIDELQKFLREYSAIVCFCKEAREKAIDANAKEFAQQFAGSFTK